MGDHGGVLLTSALFDRYRTDIMGTSASSPVFINALVRLAGGQAALPAFRADLARVTGRSDIDVWDNYVAFGGPVRKVTGYEAACLLAFGLAALLAALFLVGQAIIRYASGAVTELRVLQSVGLTRAQAAASATIAPALSAIAGAALGVAAAIVVSRRMPIGAASIAEPHPGVDADWLVLGVGWAAAQLLGPAGRVERAVAANHDVTGFLDVRIGGAQSGQLSIESFTYAPVDGKRVPVVLTAGRLPDGPAEVALAPTTARALHAGVGSAVRLSGAPAPRTMTVSGIAFVPAGPHNAYDEGVWLTPAGYDRIFRGAHYAFKFHAALAALRPRAAPQAVARELDASAAAVTGGHGPAFAPPDPLPVSSLRTWRCCRWCSAASSRSSRWGRSGTRS